MNTQPSSQDNSQFTYTNKLSELLIVERNPKVAASAVVNAEAVMTVAERIAPLADLDASERKDWLLDHVEEFTDLPPQMLAKMQKMLVELYQVQRAWIERQLVPLIKELRKEKKRNMPELKESERIRADLEAITGGTFALNECTQAIFVAGKEVDTGLMADVRVGMRDRGWKSMKAVEDVLIADAYKNSYHPIRKFMDGLVWDGEDHIAQLGSFVTDKHEPIKYADGTIRPVFTAWLHRWMVGLISKLYTAHTQNPVLVIDGKQGIGKSEIPLWLSGPFIDFYTEKSINPEDKELERMLAGTLIWEIAEFGHTSRKADREALKSILTRHYVTFRVPYAQNMVKRPIMTSFFGTINEEGGGFLSDPTGNRRFIVAEIAAIDWTYKQQVNLEQVWAQAYAAYKAGERGILTYEEVERRDAINHKYEYSEPIGDLLATRFRFDPSKVDDPAWRMTATDMLMKLQDNGCRVDLKSGTTAVGIYMKRRGVPRTDNHPRFYKGLQWDPAMAEVVGLQST